jgi:hypothetical protein
MAKRDSLARYAAQLARLGGKLRAKKLTAEQRREIARKAARAVGERRVEGRAEPGEEGANVKLIAFGLSAPSSSP